MRNTMIGVIVMIAGMSVAQTFTDLDTTKHQGKTGLKDLITGIDANFALIEAGTVPAPLAAAKIFVGNAAGKAAAQTVSGDVTIATNGAVAIASGVIVNADVNAAAAIASSKLATDVVRSGDTTPKQLIQAGSLNVADMTLQTNTFTVAYENGTTPIVVATYATTAADVAPVYITSVSSNSFVATIAATNMPINWIAIGQKP